MNAASDRFSVPRSFAIYVRSIAFNVLFYLNLTAHMIVALPTLALPYPCLRVFIRSYARTSLWLLRVVCGTKVDWRGAEKLPNGPCIVACKHQSLWETFSLYALLDDPAYVLKRELMWLPLFGWYMRKAGLIPIDRGAGMAALARMTARTRQALTGARPRQVVIFPEGTRRPPGAEPSYKPGIVHLYNKAGVPCVPLALNSGLFWPRRSLLRLPGTIIAEVLDPIPPGLDRDTFFTRLQDAIETASARLLDGIRKRDSSVRRLTSGYRCLIPDPRLQMCGKQMQIALAIAERLERQHRLQHIIAIGPGAAVALPHMMQAFGERQAAGILDVASIDDVAQRPDAMPRLVLKLDLPHGFEIDRRDLLAAAQIGDGLGALGGGDAIGDAAAHAAAIEPEHQAGPLRRTAMDEGIDAKRPVQANQPGRNPLDMGKSRTPHQRAIAEYPKIPGFALGSRMHCASMLTKALFRSPNRMRTAAQWRRLS